MYQLSISNRAKKDLKQLDKPVLKAALTILEDIAERPHEGEPLRGNLSHLKKRSFSHMGNEYRIAYQIYESFIKVKVFKIGSRENFYDELKRRI